MNNFLKSLFLLALLPLSALFAQDEQAKQRHNLKLAFEVGTNMMQNGLEKPEQIRENRTSGYFYKDQ